MNDDLATEEIIKLAESKGWDRLVHQLAIKLPDGTLYYRPVTVYQILDWIRFKTNYNWYCHKDSSSSKTDTFIFNDTSPNGKHASIVIIRHSLGYYNTMRLGVIEMLKKCF